LNPFSSVNIFIPEIMKFMQQRLLLNGSINKLFA